MTITYRQQILPVDVINDFRLLGKNKTLSASALTVIIKKYFSCVNPKLVLRNPKTIASLFKFKDSVPKLMRSLVVYKYTCPRCNLGTYLGSTKRMLKVRIDSHWGISYRTGCNMKTKEFSSIRNHS